MPHGLAELILLAEWIKNYLKRVISSKISDILILASSTFANLRLVLMGLKLANSKISDGRSD